MTGEIVRIPKGRQDLEREERWLKNLSVWKENWYIKVPL